MTLTKSVLSTVLMTTFLSACSFAPKHTVPEMPGDDVFKEAASYGAYWKEADKNAGQADRSNWWLVFNDPQLNALEEEAGKNNLDLQIAALRVEQAEAAIDQVRSRGLPTVDLNAGFNGQDMGGVFGSFRNYTIYGSVSQSIDVFGRIRAATRAAKLDKQQVEQLYGQVMLVLQADVAQNYFLLKSLDTESDLLEQTVKLREESLGLVKKRFTEGEASEQESLRAEAELATTKAELSALKQQRATVEHALAILLGKPPSAYTQARSPLPTALPLIPAGLPSRVIERRPDIAAAQAALAAANERIGLARAAFFPSITITAQGGLASPDIAEVFQWSSRSWLLSPIASLPIFDGGRRKADLKISTAQHQQSVATYRKTVLTAFKEVEDALSSLHLQAERAEQLYKAADAAKKASSISEIRYREGESNYLETLDTQRDTLAAQRAYTQTQGQRFITTVGLIRALGGGWNDVQTQAAQTVMSQPAVAPAPAKVQESAGTPLAPVVTAPVAPPQATPQPPVNNAYQKMSPSDSDVSGLIFDN